MSFQNKKNPQITYGLLNGNLVHVDSVPNGISCDCSCPSCGELLVAKQGKINNHHFAHISGADCPGSYETLLHLFAKETLANAEHIQLPTLDVEIFSVRYQRSFLFRPNHCPGGKFNISSVRLEENIGDIIPDIVLESPDGSKLLVEIYVTHKVDETKFKKIEEIGIPTIEVDLSDFKIIDGDSVHKLQELLINQVGKKRWVYEPSKWNARSLNRFIQFRQFESFEDWKSECPRKEGIMNSGECRGSIPCHYCDFKLCENNPLESELYGIYCIGNYDVIKQPELYTMLLKDINKIFENHPLLCPNCNSLMVERYGRYGGFWGCLNFPECRYAASYNDMTDNESHYNAKRPHFCCPRCGAELKA